MSWLGRRVAVGLGLSLVASAPLFAQVPDGAPTEALERASAHFGEGNRLAAAGDEAGAREAFASALLRYQQAAAELDPAVNGRLLYNIGNTHLRLGDVGRAIVAFRRAERVIPGDRNLRQSLDHARSLRQGTLGNDDARWIGAGLLAWHRFVPAAARLALMLVAFNVAWLAGGWLLLLRNRGGAAGSPAHAVLRWTAIAGVALVAMTALSIAAETLDVRREAGAIVTGQIVGRLGDSAAYEPSHSAPLTAGIEFRVVERRGGWLHIALQDGSRGWIPESAAQLL